MKRFLYAAAGLALTAGISTALAGEPVSDAGVSRQMDELNATAQVIDTRLQQILTALNQSAQTGVCWLDGKAFSQGSEATVGGRDAVCSVQSKTGWPEWKKGSADSGWPVWQSVQKK